MVEEMRIVGKSISLREGYSKVTGMEKFAPDRGVAGALWMKILRSPHPHARIRKIDISKVKAFAGIAAVITHQDVPQREILCKINNWRGRILEDRVRFVGDEIAAIAGETEEIAEKALDLIEVEYEKLPAVFSMEEALSSDAPDVRGVGSNKISCPPDPGPFSSLLQWGNIEEGFKEANATVELEVETGRQYLSFCPAACLAEWNGDKLTLMLSHQCPYDIREIVANVLDMPQHKVRIIAPLMAQSFGMLNSAHRFWYLAALLARKLGKPVIYKMTMEEYGVYKSRDSDLIRIKMGGKKAGVVTALDYKILHDNGAYGWKSTGYGNMHDIFSRSNVRYNDWGVCTNKFSTGCIRGVGNVPQSLAVNLAVDMLAEKLGVDPLTIWKKNHIKAGDLLRFGMPGLTLSSEAYDELIDKGAEVIGWKRKWNGWGKAYDVIGPKKRGVGMAVGIHCAGFQWDPASATIYINHDGSVQVLIGSMDLGTGCKTTFAQICAEVLGFKVEDVHVVKDIDTETVPYMIRTAASRSLRLGGSAVKVAATDAKRQLLEMAYAAPWSPQILKKGIEKPEELDIKDSMIYVKTDPGRRVAIKEITNTMSAPLIIGRATRHELPADPTPMQTIVGFAETEVDTETGKVDVLKLVLCQDSGRIINREICENQVYGGILQSFGYALMEEVVFDPATGKSLNPALIDYWTPTSLDAPPMEVIFSDNIDPVGPFGAKGLGEGPTICPHAAIANAIYNAIGVRICQLPITPDKVLKALGK